MGFLLLKKAHLYFQFTFQHCIMLSLTYKNPLLLQGHCSKHSLAYESVFLMANSASTSPINKNIHGLPSDYIMVRLHMEALTWASFLRKITTYLVNSVIFIFLCVDSK